MKRAFIVHLLSLACIFTVAIEPCLARFGHTKNVYNVQRYTTKNQRDDYKIVCYFVSKMRQLYSKSKSLFLPDDFYSH